MLPPRELEGVDEEAESGKGNRVRITRNNREKDSSIEIRLLRSCCLIVFLTYQGHD